MTATNTPVETLISNLEKRDARKLDFIAPAKKILWTPENEFEIQLQDTSTAFYTPSELFKQQVSEKLGIPMHYFRKMETKTPELLAQNVNGWLNHFGKSNFLVRGLTNDGTN